MYSTQAVGPDLPAGAVQAQTDVIYTDGSQKPRPGRGGIGMVLCWTNEEGHEEEHWESPLGYRGVTIPQMELKAVIEGLKLLLKKPPIVPPHLAGTPTSRKPTSSPRRPREWANSHLWYRDR
jgi:hypothetical protein